MVLCLDGFRLGWFYVWMFLFKNVCMVLDLDGFMFGWFYVLMFFGFDGFI